MNELKKKLSKYNFKINSIKYIGKVIIINTDQGKYVYKEKNNYKIYEYLELHGFNYFPKNINDKNSNYDLVSYIEETELPRSQKIDNLLNIVSYLHKKTSCYKEIDLDELKSMYENIKNDADYLMNYYNDLNNVIDSKVFMSPYEYLLVRNINLFYYLISFVQVEIKNWYENIIKNKQMRYVFIHNNLDIKHLLINNSVYLISWNKACIDLPYKDIKKIFENYFLDIDIENYLIEYSKNNKLNDQEYLFLLINLVLPKRIEFTNNTYDDCYKLNNYIEYLKKNVLLIQKFDKSKHKV